MSKSFYIPSLDGMRAVAVMIVFVGHGALIGGPWPGHLGVTIFFFLSGYLITTLLRREYEASSRISLPSFYMRRLIRITPPALVSIILCSLAGFLLLVPSNQNVWGTLATILNYTNYYIVYSDGHGGLPPESSMLWSLAVEEHFYLLFPAALLIMLRRRLSYRRVASILLVAVVLAPVWRVLLALNGAGFYRLYTSTDTRFDGLLAGAAFALVCNPVMGDRLPFEVRERFFIRWVMPAAVVALALLSVVPRPVRVTIADTPIYALLAVIFWGIIVFPQRGLARLLNHRWVMHLGALSYSMYLVHRLILAVVHQHLPNPLISDLVALIITLVTAQAIYAVVEKPLAALRRRMESRAR